MVSATAIESGWCLEIHQLKNDEFWPQAYTVPTRRDLVVAVNDRFPIPGH